MKDGKKSKEDFGGVFEKFKHKDKKERRLSKKLKPRERAHRKDR
jgi:hypothetical protein